MWSTGTGEASPLPGLFYGGGFTQLIHQAIGVAAVFAWAVAGGLVVFYGLKYTIGLRVSAHEEVEGLDVGEHGYGAYHGFVLTSTPEA